MGATERNEFQRKQDWDLTRRACSSGDQPLQGAPEHHLSRPAGVAAEGRDPGGHAGFAGDCRGRGDGVGEDHPAAEDGGGAGAGDGF